jgi:NAD+ synthase (glutamine-hydrolysing)
MPGALRIALCQLNPTVGDLTGNRDCILSALDEAAAGGAQLAVYPELAITGYPPEDLLLKPGFVEDNREVLDEIVARAGATAALVGFVDRDENGCLFNAAALCRGGELLAVYRKYSLPNYSVFDEERYFEPGPGGPAVFDVDGVRVAVAICEDIWWPSGPLAGAASAGAELAVVLNASPYYARRAEDRQAILRARAAEAACPIVFVNQVGGQDELIFDGGSMAVGADGELRAVLPQFQECVRVVDLDELTGPRGTLSTPATTTTSEVYDALVLGTRDYARKNGFREVVFGLSGGIDSSLVACIVADALGPENVHAVALPSRYTADESNDYAARLAQNLGIDLRSIAIEAAFEPMLELLAPSFEGTESGVAEENLQGRIRSALLWSLSNKLGWLVLVCGNKSELAVGYTTAYGVDMAGGFAPIKDVWKTEVYALSRERNRRAGYDLIPEEVIERPPTAELRPGQTDQDSLPPYEVLDPILEGFVEQDRTATELIEAGHDPELVNRIVGMVDRAEWKRRQAPPGVRVSPKAFGRDRRMPITNRYRG